MRLPNKTVTTIAGRRGGRSAEVGSLWAAGGSFGGEAADAFK